MSYRLDRMDTDFLVTSLMYVLDSPRSDYSFLKERSPPFVLASTLAVTSLQRSKCPRRQSLYRSI